MSDQSLRLELPTPVLLELRGPDAVRYLNGQVTQDVRLIKDDEKALTACVTDAKGKLQFRVHLHGHGGALRISCDHEGKEDLLARLDRYLIADDAELLDITDAWQLLHLTGTLPDLPERAYAIAANRIGIEGWDIWLPTGTPTVLSSVEAWNPDAAETQRITTGLPAWGSELTPGMLPPEAALEKTDISYFKGCYIGQEVISRIKSAGKVNRRLTRLSLPESVVVNAGDLLIDAEGKEAGLITSAAPLPDSGTRALLGYIRRQAAEAPVFHGPTRTPLAQNK